MLSNFQIQNLARQNQTTELNVLREYWQHLFLGHFYQQAGSGNIFFKGGTALRIVYNSPRFSEDLDFSSTAVKSGQIEDILERTLLAMEGEGLRVEIGEAKATSGGYLAKVIVDSNIIQLEISLRQGKRAGEPVTVISDLAIPYTIVVLEKRQLVGEKIQALLTRGKARDYYDLYFMLRSNLLDLKEKKNLPLALEKLKQSRVVFDKELKIFLPRSHWAIINDFKKVLEMEMGRYV